MSEEVNIDREMDRKPSGRTSSAQPKGNGGECKKDNYNKNGKGGYKKENAGPRPRNDQGNKRPYSQKPRPIDRKPRPREGYNYRQGEQVTDDYRADSTSALKRGNKKTNLNHLLNFSVSSREGDAYFDGFHGCEPPKTSSNRYGKRNARRSATSSYNKEQFLQANCQFVVKEGDYTVHAADPDILVDWDHIEQIRIYSNEVPSCPICLFPPVAAKMTRCGHIYCWRCMLHYLSLSEKKTWRKCPICYEAVHQKDLKSVCALETHSYKCGEEITMRLMKREKDSTYAMPVDQWQDRQRKPQAISEKVELAFSKLLVASPDDVQSMILDVEKTALETQLAEEGESLEGSYVKAAMELLKERQVSVNMAKAAKECVHEKPEALGQRDSPKPMTHPSENSFAPLRKDVVEYVSAFSDEEVTSTCEDASSPEVIHASASAPSLQGLDRTLSESSDETRAYPLPPSNQEDHALPSNTMSLTTADGQKVEVSVDEAAEELVLPGPPLMADENARNEGGAEKGASKRSNAFFFYQASDGQQIYMQSLNARCMVKEYGSLENCPVTVTAKIVEMEGISMNEELRGRLRYLNHLPLTCEFKVAELALKPPTVSRDTLNFFAEDIERRKRARQRKNRDERRQLRKMQDKENRKYEHCPEMRAFLGNHHFPENASTIVKSEMPTLLGATSSERPLSPAMSTPETMTPIGSPAASVELGSSPHDDGGQTSRSFAQMLRAKPKAAQPAWPKLGGASGVSATSGVGSQRAGASDESDNEDRVPVPLFRESFGDAIKKALDKHDKNPGSTVAVETSLQQVDGSTAGGKKKKKKTKTLLFTTTMARNK